jgi:hypothetical protein
MNENQESNAGLTDALVVTSDLLGSFPRLNKDGRTAVLYSPGYGAGWSSWNNDAWKGVLTMHREIVERVMSDDRGGAAKTAERLIREATGKPCEYVCTLGADDLKVAWVDAGARFEIKEYDGSESLHVLGDRSYLST